METLDFLNESVYYSPDTESESYSDENFIDYSNNDLLRWTHIDFEMFSKLAPNTWVSLQLDQHFSPVSGTYSCFYGAQFAASYIVGYLPEKFLSDFTKFVTKVIHCARKVFKQGDEAQNKKYKHICFSDLHAVGQVIRKALNGEVVNGGLNGLLITHFNDSIHDKLKNEINRLKDSIKSIIHSSRSWIVTDFTRSQIRGTSNKLPYWPEKTFTDQDWENAIALSAKLTPESASLEKYFHYCASFVGDQVAKSTGSEKLWDQILERPNGACLFLGSMPVIQGLIGKETRNDISDLKKNNVRAVLSVAEIFETQSSGLITSPVTPLQWKNAGIKHLQIPVSNFQTPSFECLLKGIAFIHWCLERNETILVHCNIDSIRSSLMVMGYLILYQNCSVVNAFDFIQERRPSMAFKKDSEKMLILNEFEKKCKRTWNRM